MIQMITDIIIQNSSDQNINPGEIIELKGWIKRHRSSGKIIFMTIRDSTGEIQCVAKKADMKEEQFELLKNALIESSVQLSGLIKSDERAPGGHELTINSGEIIGADIMLEFGHYTNRDSWSRFRMCYYQRNRKWYSIQLPV